MPDSLAEEWDNTPTIEVRVYRRGELIATELCESEAQASDIVDQWAELDGVTCEVDDMSVHHQPAQILAPEPAEDEADGYPEQTEQDIRSSRIYED